MTAIKAVTDLPARLYGGNAQEVEVSGLDYTLHLDIAKLPIVGSEGATDKWTVVWDENNHTYGRVEFTNLPAPNAAWVTITGKPATFPPSAHTHVIADTTGLQTALDSKGPLNWLQSGAGAVTTTVDAKLKDATPTPSDRGAVGNGVTNDTVAIQAAENIGGRIALPKPFYLTTINAWELRGQFDGPGQVIDAAGNRRAPIFRAVPAPPSSFGVESDPDSAFNGDLRGVAFPVEHRITGAATLGQPTTGYTVRAECCPMYTYLYNASGHNEALDSNIGRTGVAAHRVRAVQNGQGDVACWTGSVFVTGTKAGSTSFLANPAGCFINGDMSAGANGVYLNPLEFYLEDQGFDVACVGPVINLYRTNNTGAKGVFWAGERIQSVGTQPIDAAWSATGKMRMILDGTKADVSSTNCAIALTAGQRIYLDTSNTGETPKNVVFGNSYIEYNATNSAFTAVVGNTTSFLATAARFTVLTSFVTGGSLGFYGATPINKPTVSGARGGNAALASLLTALSNFGLIIDTTT